MPQLLIFDLDGTLIDSKSTICECLGFALRRFGLPEPDEATMSAFIGPFTLENGFRQLHPELSCADIDELARLHRSRYTEICCDAEPFPHVPETLAQLRAAGNELAIASMKRPHFTRKILCKHSLDTLFSAIMGAGDSAEPTKQSIVEAVLARFAREGYGASFMIGDMPDDIRAGRHHGLVTIAVGYGYAPVNELEREAPDFVVRDFSEIAAIACGSGKNR